MRILLLTHGTRGDVQPFTALARAAEAAGHEAVVGGPAASAPVAQEHGVRYVPLDDGPNRLMDDPAIMRSVETNFRGVTGKLDALRLMRRSKPLMARVVADLAAVARQHTDTDIVVHQPGLPAHHVAERLGVPAVPACLQPFWVPTPAFPHPMAPVRPPSALNRLSYAPMGIAVRLLGGPADTLRADLGLARRPHRHDFLRRPDGGPAPVLQGFSRHVLPAAVDYPDWVHTTGYWFLPAPPAWAPEDRLADFLAAGDPPVYIGFGSMSGADPDRAGRTVLDAVRRAGVRAVLVAGWGGIRVARPPKEVLFLDRAPHAWLFPRMAAVVHHGGGGTTGAALASGRPQVVCPYAADQPFWARRMHALGLAPPPLPQRHLTVHGLAEAIGLAVADPTMAARADVVGARVRAEHGAATAVRVLESLV